MRENNNKLWRLEFELLLQTPHPQDLVFGDIYLTSDLKTRR